VWNSWNLTERRMIMSIAYTIVAAIALMLALFWDNRRVGAIGQVVTSFAMAVGLAWIELGPAGEDVHPASAVLSSPDIAFKVYAFMMMGGCLLMVLALAVPVRRWLRHGEGGA
jgi:predicted anti-sigma-YlaC factor YlaD